MKVGCPPHVVLKEFTDGSLSNGCFSLNDGEMNKETCVTTSRRCLTKENGALGDCPDNRKHQYRQPLEGGLKFNYILYCTRLDNDCRNHASSTENRCTECCSSTNCNSALIPCSQTPGFTADKRNAKVKVKVLMKRLDSGNVRCGSANIKLTSNSSSCITSKLPEAVLPERGDLEWVILDNSAL